MGREAGFKDVFNEITIENFSNMEKELAKKKKKYRKGTRFQ